MKRLLFILLLATLLTSCQSEPGRQIPEESNGEAQPPRPPDPLAAQRLPFGLFRDAQTGEELMVLQDDSQGTRVYYAPSRTGEWKHLKANANQAQRSFCFEGGTCHSLLPSDAGSGGIACHNPDGTRQFFSALEMSALVKKCLVFRTDYFYYEQSDELFSTIIEEFTSANTDRQADIEQELIASATQASLGRVTQPTSGMWVIQTEQREVELKSNSPNENNTLECRYIFVAYEPGIHAFIFARRHILGTDFTLVHDITGEQIKLDWAPAPSPANDGVFFVKVPQKSGGVVRPEILIYRATEEKFEVMWEYLSGSSNEEWGWDLIRPIWLGPDRLCLIRRSFLGTDNPNADLGHRPVLLTRNGTNWELKPFHIN